LVVALDLYMKKITVVLALSLGACGSTDPTGSFPVEGDGPPAVKSDGYAAYMTKVTPELHRGSQPDERWIWSLTVPSIRGTPFKTVINLRAEDNSEAPIVRKYGMTPLNIPVIDFTAPKTDQVVQFLDFVTQAKNQPAYVHCHAGQGRTSTFVSSYRMAVQGWSVDDAVAEAKSYNANQAQLDFLRAFADKLADGSVQHYDEVR
jgi:protein tyrosine phosphatase (PTP) superfamily phosphohydrolase (DUF442 family)